MVFFVFVFVVLVVVVCFTDCFWCFGFLVFLFACLFVCWLVFLGEPRIYFRCWIEQSESISTFSGCKKGKVMVTESGDSSVVECRIPDRKVSGLNPGRIRRDIFLPQRTTVLC